MRTYQIVLGGVVLMTFIAAVTLHADARHQPHTLGIVYTSTGVGMSALPLVKSEVVEFLRDVVSPNAPVATTTFVLA
jgi:hypothetical protein